jgi:hypothetical protein
MIHENHEEIQILLRLRDRNGVETFVRGAMRESEIFGSILRVIPRRKHRLSYLTPLREDVFDELLRDGRFLVIAVSNFRFDRINIVEWYLKEDVCLNV